jgi:hypothetical protein
MNVVEWLDVEWMIETNVREKQTVYIHLDHELTLATRSRNNYHPRAPVHLHKVLRIPPLQNSEGILMSEKCLPYAKR